MLSRLTEMQNRVLENSDPAINDRLRKEQEMRLSYYSQHKDKIEERLQEIDREIDIERALQLGASGTTLFSLLMSVVGRKWFFIALAAQGFYFQQATQGWCPPLNLLRRLGFRTVQEIDSERYALRYLRGDFKDLEEQASSEKPEQQH